MYRLLGTVIAFFFLIGCGGTSTSESGSKKDGTQVFSLIKDDTLTVCTDVPYLPMEFEDAESESGFNGFDINLVETVAVDLDLGVEIVTPGWDAIQSGLAFEANNCDVAVSAITITEEREERIDFSDPYFSAKQSLLVASNSDAEAAGDLEKIAVQSGTTGEIYAQENLENELSSFENADGMYLALEANNVDGVITDLVANQGYIQQNNDETKIIQEWETDEEYGFAFPQNDESIPLREAINESLKKLNDDGTYDKIFNKWFPKKK